MIASLISSVLLCLFGAAIIIVAINARRLIVWENRQLTRLADRVKAWRERLEAQQGGAPHV